MEEFRQGIRLAGQTDFEMFFGRVPICVGKRLLMKLISADDRRSNRIIDQVVKPWA